MNNQIQRCIEMLNLYPDTKRVLSDGKGFKMLPTDFPEELDIEFMKVGEYRVLRQYDVKDDTITVMVGR